jgi:hypothetical protein
MSFTMQFDMDNAAFDDDPATEAARIIEEVASLIKEGAESGECRDINGNFIGNWRMCD